MANIPPDLQRWRQHYRALPGEQSIGRFGCGIIVHPPGQPGQVDFLREEAGSLVWLLQGAGDYHDALGRRARLQPGAAFVRHPGLAHSSRADAAAGEWIEFFVHLPASCIQTCYECGVIDRDELCWQLGHPRELLAQARELLRMMPDEATLDTASCLVEMLRFLDRARQIHRRNTAVNRTELHLNQACARLRSHLDRHCSIEDLARDLGIGFEWLRRHLRSQLGMSPAAYRRRLRMEQAEILLDEPGTPITAIAEAVGYSDLFAFSKAFKRHSGLSPRAWRRQRTC